MPQDLIESYNLMSEMTINGVPFTIKDAAAQSDIQDIAYAIIENNTAIGTRINDLNTRLESIESVSYENVQADWNENDSTSYSYILNKPDIPNDAYLVHTTGNEIINGEKQFNDDIYLFGENVGTTLKIDSSGYIERTTAGYPVDANFEWIKHSYGVSGDIYTLQQALDLRNNVKANWNESDNTSYAYILNKPEIPDDTYLVHTIGDETITGTKTFEDVFAALYSEYSELSGVKIIPNNTENSLQLISDAINGTAYMHVGDDLDNTGGWNQIINLSTNTTLEDELSYRDNVKSNWNESDATSYAYILNKPEIPNDNDLLHVGPGNYVIEKNIGIDEFDIFSANIYSSNIYDNNGNPYWWCSITISPYELDHACVGRGPTKKEAKREACYKLLCDLMGYKHE